ncbi:MFS transporter, CP family, cyanate transporter [Parafrankia irregularis]|uniref:MFS transporter, CP family, cyanate transporter n=1 Tax=Parafrankia irregularis TaxID=795642 RepID=A0A0S4QME7_9ACTN|nr:MFS transporter [Parafrankia sp. CH37]CUU56028.1 MFS transporter, CP family, cyanate transporter [Parafrankia irregularis]
MEVQLVSEIQDRPKVAVAAQPRHAPAALGFAVIALFAAAVNLRPAIAALSPLVDRIRADLGLSATEVSLLTTIPTLAMGLCAPLAVAVGRRWGLHRGVLLGLAVVGLATAARGLGQSAWLQLVCAAAVGMGIALSQTLLPAVVKTRFADRPGLVTGIYTTGLGLGGAVAAGVSTPLADAFDSWPAALAFWAILAVAGLLLWSAAKGSLRLEQAGDPKRIATSGLPWRSRLAWRITAVSAGNSALYYCELAWIAPLLHDDGGRSESQAGLMLTTMIAIQVAAMLAVPALHGERQDRRAGLAATTVLTAIGFLGFALSPEAGAWLWIVAMGVGHGGLFTLVMTLPVAASRDAAQAGRFSAMAFFIGYACAAAGPVVVGGLRDATGDFQLGFGLLAAVAALMLLPIARLSPRRIAQAQHHPSA